MATTKNHLSILSDPPSQSSFCKLLTISDDKQLYSGILSFIHQHASTYDRFILLFPHLSSNLITSFFNGELISASRLAENASILPLLYPRLLQHPEEQERYFKMFRFLEQFPQRVQLLGLPLEDAGEFFNTYDIDNPSTCLVFIDLDRCCYHTTTLMFLHTVILPKLSQWCGYFFISHQLKSSGFYRWFASFLHKNLTTDTSSLENISNVVNWEILTIGESPLEFQNEINISPVLTKLLQKEWAALPYTESLFSDTSITKRNYAIQELNQRPREKKAWLKCRELTLALLIINKMSFKKRILVITNHFTNTSWGEFQLHFAKLEISVKTTPSFLPVDELYNLEETLKDQKFDQILLDLGDELTPWLSVPFLDTLLEKTSFIQRINTEDIPVTFIRPILSSEENIRWLLSTPPIPTHLIRSNSSNSSPTNDSVIKQQRELLHISCLLLAVRRKTKSEFYSTIQSYWIQDLISTSILQSLPQIIRLFRCTGLFHRLHFHTTPLGKFFLDNRLLLTDFLNFLQANLPDLLERPLFVPLTKELFHTFYIACAKWFFHTTKYTDFSSPQLAKFLYAIQTTYTEIAIEPTLEYDVISAIEELVRQETSSYPNLSAFFHKRTKKLTSNMNHKPIFSINKRRKTVKGAALLQVISDIQDWMQTFKRSDGLFPESIFFHIRKMAHIAAREDRNIDESSYIRAVKRLVTQSLTKRMLTAFKPESRIAILEMNSYCQRNLILLSRVVNPLEAQLVGVIHESKKKSLILVPRQGSLITKSNYSRAFPYVYFSCKSCSYFEKRRKRDCILLNKVNFINRKRIPTACIGREKGVFSSLIGCPLWRPYPEMTIFLAVSRTFQCVHCNQLIPALSDLLGSYHCHCGTTYRFFYRNENGQVIVEYRLSKEISLNQTLQLLFPNQILVKGVMKLQDYPIPSKNLFNPAESNFLTYRESSDKYLFIKKSDSVYYDEEMDNLGILNVFGTGSFHSLDTIKLIDSQKPSKYLVTLLSSHPNIKINIRTSYLTLSPADRATISYNVPHVPTLNVKRERGSEEEKYSFLDLISVYNTGKPRLNRLLKKWGVEVIYRSTKGISKEASEEIKEALALEGVRPILSDIHLLGLVISAIHATSYMINLMHKEGLHQMANHYLWRMKRLLFTSPTRLKQFYLDKNPDSPKNRTSLEAWIFRPFAEGIRRLILKIQSDQYPMITRPYGRTVARMVWKQEKINQEYMGGYTPFDSALNTMNRVLRYQLRVWNAKLGLGFNMEPLFGHQSIDKPGRAGHLDLEEPGRIVTRLVLTQQIIAGNLQGYHFEAHLDDESLVFFVPWINTLRDLQRNFVQHQVLNTKVRYNNQWLPYSLAHQQYVKHLTKLLLKCRDYDDARSREEWLTSNFSPLIFDSGLDDYKTELLSFFDKYWLEQAKNLLPQLEKFSPVFINQNLIKSLQKKSNI